jgi:hypothetical protein
LPPSHQKTLPNWSQHPVAFTPWQDVADGSTDPMQTLTFGAAWPLETGPMTNRRETERKMARRMWTSSETGHLQHCGGGVSP